MVDPGIGADIALSGLGDEDSFGAQHADTLVQHHLHHPRIRARDEMGGNSHCLRAGLDILEADDAALGLRDDLLRDRHQVARLQ